MEKGKDLLTGERIVACSMSSDDTHIYLSGIVGAAFKTKGVDQYFWWYLNRHDTITGWWNCL